MASRIRCMRSNHGARALVEGERSLDYATLDRHMDRIAVALQRDGDAPGAAGRNLRRQFDRVRLRLPGAPRGVVMVAPLAPGATPASPQRMLGRRRAKLLFTTDEIERRRRRSAASRSTARRPAGRSTTGSPAAKSPRPVAIEPGAAFNIIYCRARPASPRASCSRMRCAGPTIQARRSMDTARHGDAARDAAVLEHHAGGVLPDAGTMAAPCC